MSAGAERLSARRTEAGLLPLDACRRGVERIASEVGPVEVLVNNAGTSRPSRFHDMTEMWQAVLDVDLSGCFDIEVDTERLRHHALQLRER